MRKWWKRGKTWRKKTCQTTVGQLPRDNLFLELVSISTSARHPFFSHFLLSLTLASLHLDTLLTGTQSHPPSNLGLNKSRFVSPVARREWHTWLGSCPSWKEMDLKPCHWSTILGERKQFPLPCPCDVSEEGGEFIWDWNTQGIDPQANHLPESLLDDVP